MTILCGTDFTPAALEAERVALGLAVAAREPLLLVHALPDAGQWLRTGSTSHASGAERELRAGLDTLCASLEQRLAEEVVGLRKLWSATDARVGQGDGDVVLAQLAEEEHATLVVVAALGTRAEGMAKLGSTSDRLAQTCHRPLLVVRSAEHFEPWLAGARALKVAVAYEPSSSSDVALRWALGLSRWGAIEITLLHSYHLTAERSRRGVTGPLPIGKHDAAVEEPLERELLARAHALGLPPTARVALRGGLGRPIEPLIGLLRECSAELIVVGNHHRRGLERLWHGSVSQGVLEQSTASVACISEPLLG